VTAAGGGNARVCERKRNGRRGAEDMQYCEDPQSQLETTNHAPNAKGAAYPIFRQGEDFLAFRMRVVPIARSARTPRLQPLPCGASVSCTTPTA
jgi:hypothetical protein